MRNNSEPRDDHCGTPHLISKVVVTISVIHILTSIMQITFKPWEGEPLQTIHSQFTDQNAVVDGLKNLR